MPNYNDNGSYVGLGTYEVLKAPTTGIYTFQAKLSLPSITKGDATSSSVIAVINRNGSPIYTSQLGADGFSTTTSLTLNDVVTVVLSSAAAVDQGKNTVRMTLSVWAGA